MRNRALSSAFLDDLKIGILRPLVGTCKRDSSLQLELRGNYVSIYYRGSSILKVQHGDTGNYLFSVDSNYFGLRIKKEVSFLPRAVRCLRDVTSWITVLPNLKLGIDSWLSKHPKEEREFQQLIARDNNCSTVSNATDYFICDIEYSNGNARFDMGGICWPSTSIVRKSGCARHLSLIEVKYGDNAVAGSAGLKKHVADLLRFANNAENVELLKADMLMVFHQKHQLGLVNIKHPMSAIEEAEPELVFVLINHDPAKSALARELDEIRVDWPFANVKVAFASCMGYGLFCEHLLPLDIALGNMRK